MRGISFSVKFGPVPGFWGWDGRSQGILLHTPALRHALKKAPSVPNVTPIKSVKSDEIFISRSSKPVSDLNHSPFYCRFYFRILTLVHRQLITGNINLEGLNTLVLLQFNSST